MLFRQKNNHEFHFKTLSNGDLIKIFQSKNCFLPLYKSFDIVRRRFRRSFMSSDDERLLLLLCKFMAIDYQKYLNTIS